MKLKKIISILLCAAIAASAGTSAQAFSQASAQASEQTGEPVSVPASYAQAEYPETISEPVRILDGIAEMVTKLFGMISFRRKYDDCKPVYELPELEKGVVPQGFCYIDAMDIFAVTYYSDDDENSMAAFINASTGERIKTVKLCYEDGSPCKAHAGGIADIGDSVLISSGKSMRRLVIADALAAGDYSEVRFSGKLNSDMQCSYACSCGNYLFVGQYYTFTLKGSYDTPPEQRIYTPDGKRNYAMCEVFDLTDMDSVFAAEKAVPVAALSVPNLIQGIAYDGKTFAVSCSASYAPSTLKKYSVDINSADGRIMLGENEVPLIYLAGANLISSVKQPPMLEGIDICGGKVMGIFESGAEKFGSAPVRTPYICEFGEM